MSNKTTSTLVASGTPNPHGDGETHINIAFRGETRLGRMLSPYYRLPFNHPFFGRFNSIEGFWHYIRIAEKPDEFRMLVGEKAKQFARNFASVRVDGFQEIIEVATHVKIDQNQELKNLVIESTLEFDMYHLVGPSCVVVRPLGHAWQVKMFERVRKMIKNGEPPAALDYTALAKKR